MNYRVVEIDPKMLCRDGKLLSYEFSKEGAPKTGIAYWRWAAVKYNEQLYIIEVEPVEGKLQVTVKLVDY